MRPGRHCRPEGAPGRSRQQYLTPVVHMWLVLQEPPMAWPVQAERDQAVQRVQIGKAYCWWPLSHVEKPTEIPCSELDAEEPSISQCHVPLPL